MLHRHLMKETCTLPNSLLLLWEYYILQMTHPKWLSTKHLYDRLLLMILSSLYQNRTNSCLAKDPFLRIELREMHLWQNGFYCVYLNKYAPAQITVYLMRSDDFNCMLWLSRLGWSYYATWGYASVVIPSLWWNLTLYLWLKCIINSEK